MLTATTLSTAMVPLPDLRPRLAELTDDRLPTYENFYKGALNGRVVTVKVNGRHFVDPSTFPAILAEYGLRSKAPTAAPKARKAPHREPIAA